MPTIKKRTKRPWIPEKKPYEGYRHHNTKFYQSTAWRKLREEKLRKNPICEQCIRIGLIIPAQVVDHIVPINKGGAALDIDNLQSLCNPCHNRKSAMDK